MATSFHILAVGRAKKGAMYDLYHHYIKRIDWSVHLHEINIKNADPAVLQQLESQALIDKIPDRAKVIALDERGNSISSVKMSDMIGEWIDQGVGDIAFIIGGADGLTDTVRMRADKIICMGKMTWPHMMVRMMLAEQLYRCRSILNNHPYHRA